jgi:hypothetical protein
MVICPALISRSCLTAFAAATAGFAQRPLVPHIGSLGLPMDDD